MGTIAAKANGNGRNRANAPVPKYNRVAVITHNKTQKRYDYGVNNLLPNELLKGIESSVTATACRFRKSEFIEGNGLADTTIASLKINPTQTADGLVMECADVAGIFDGLAITVKYNVMGEPAHVYAMPFECVRKMDDGNFYYNPDLAKGKDEKKNRVVYHPYNPAESPIDRLARMNAQIAEHGEQIGDILYVYGKRAGQKDYPVPSAWAGMEEIEADAALGRLDWRNVKKGFRPDVILTTVGRIDDETEDEFGKTERDYFNDAMMKFTGENAAPIFHNEVDNADQKPQVDTFDQEKLLNSTTEAADRIGRRVCRAMQVPDVLISGFAKQGQLGNVQEMINTLAMFQQTIGRTQRMITRALEAVFPTLDWTIEPLTLINEIPDYVLEVMTAEEKRALGGLAVMEEQATESASKVADALATISPLVATKVLSSMTEAEIRAIVGLAPLAAGEVASGSKDVQQP